MTHKLKFHHIGKVVDGIYKQYGFYRKLGFSVYPGFEKKIVDKSQKVKVGAVAMGPVLVELLEPLGKNSPVSGFLKKGHGFHHICYETGSLEKTMMILKKNFKFRQITPVTISVWNGRQVVFFISPNVEIVELIGAAR